LTDSESHSNVSAPTVGALGEARLAGNGRTLAKSRNAAMALLCGSLRARREAAICGVACPWGRMATPAGKRLA